jgi:general secretion pathway protein B
MPGALLALLIAVGAVGAAAGVYWWRSVSTPAAPDAPLAEAPAPASKDAGNSPVGSLPASTSPPAVRRPSADNAARPLAQTSMPPKRPPPPPPGADGGPIPLLSAMPAEFQDRLPPMEVNIHVYSPDPEQRILYINNRSYRQGEEVTGGAVVEEVVPEGVVLYHDGQRFRLPRPR